MKLNVFNRCPDCTSNSRRIGRYGGFIVISLAIQLSGGFAALARAQSQIADQAVLQGTVRDSSGQAVAHASVSLQIKPSNQTLSTVTDSDGHYRFSNVRPASYKLKAQRTELEEASVDNVTLVAGEAKNLDLVLRTRNTSTAKDSTPQFFDQPSFTVAGVTDPSNLGGHGSDNIVRTKESMAKAAASLGTETRATSHEESREEYAKARANLRAELAQEDRAELHHSLAEIEEKTGNPVDAVREYERAAQMNPSEPYVFDWGSELLVHRASEPAFEVFAKGNREFPQSTRMLIGLGVAEYTRGFYEQAARRLCAASDLSPDDPSPYRFLSKIQNVGEPEAAAIRERLERFARLHPESAEANCYYAVSLWKVRKSPDDSLTSHVEALLQKAITLDPKLAEAHLQLGIVHAEQRHFAQAIVDYQRAIETNPRMEETHYRLAQAYRQMGEEEKGRAEVVIYEKLAKENASEADRERREIKQFVYTLREQTPAEQRK